MSPAALAAVRLVRVGSTNPPKLEGVRQALQRLIPEARVEGLDVPSGVPDQPVGFVEIVAGARQRAAGAAEAGGELAVGYEDGLVELPGLAGVWFNVGCAVLRLHEAEGLGFSSAFAYPAACAEPAVATREGIGGLFDQLWREREGEPRDAAGAASGLSVGNVGKLSGGALPRAEYTCHAVLCALAPLLHPKLYPQGVPA